MNKCEISLLTFICLMGLCISIGSAQRMGGLPAGSISGRILISNGPKGPIHGGESAVTDMILMDDGWIYGSTAATWGADSCHLFRTDGEKVEHLLNITKKLPGQTSITDLALFSSNILIGCTSTYNEIFDNSNKQYEGGHLFVFNTTTRIFEDLGVIDTGQGLNCFVVDSMHALIYCVTYPTGHLIRYDYTRKKIKDIGEIMTPWRVKDMGKVSWRGILKVLMIDDAGTIYFATYFREEIKVTEKEIMKGGVTSHSTYAGGRIYRLAFGDEKPIFTGATVPTQKGMDSDPLYENGIASAIRAKDGGFWCGTINDGFLFKFYPSTSTVINKGKAFQYWNLKSLAYGGDGKLYMLGGRDYDNSWLLCYDTMIGSIDCLCWPDNTTQCSIICTDRKGRILIAENLRHSFIYVYELSK